MTTKYISPKVANKLHKDLVKRLKIADSKKILNYDREAHSNFCADVVLMMDAMVGTVSRKYKKS